MDWLHGIPPEEHDDFIKAWRNSTYVTDKLKGILERYEKELSADRTDDYNNPMWPVLRADRNGELRALKKILRLLP